MSNLKEKYNEDDMKYVNFHAIGDLMEEYNKQAAEKQAAEKQAAEEQAAEERKTKERERAIRESEMVKMDVLYNTDGTIMKNVYRPHHFSQDGTRKSRVALNVKPFILKSSPRSPYFYQTEKFIHERERELENEQKIKNCFMAKGFKELTYRWQNPNWDLGEFISQHLTRDVLLRNTTLDELREGYKKLKNKDEEADALIEDRNAIGRMTENQRAGVWRHFEPKWKANCDRYISEVSNSFQFIKAGSSNIHLLTDSAIHRMRDTYMTSTGHIYSYDRLLSDIKDALGCWIFTLELLFPEMVNRVGGRRKRKTKKRKTKKRKTNRK
jgi:hypothetical protein